MKASDIILSYASARILDNMRGIHSHRLSSTELHTSRHAFFIGGRLPAVQQQRPKLMRAQPVCVFVPYQGHRRWRKPWCSQQNMNKLLLQVAPLVNV